MGVTREQSHRHCGGDVRADSDERRGTEIVAITAPAAREGRDGRMVSRTQKQGGPDGHLPIAVKPFPAPVDALDGHTARSRQVRARGQLAAARSKDAGRGYVGRSAHRIRLEEPVRTS